MGATKIQWTDRTWNPVTGCTKFSAGCAHCYAETMALRLKAMGLKKYTHGFSLTLHEENLNDPLKWKTPHSIFICSMSDIFHQDVPFPFIDKVIDTIKKTPHHHYQMLTKRIASVSIVCRSIFQVIPFPVICGLE
jgi:protein gp37